MADLKPILDSIIPRGYKELLGHDIQIEYEKLEDALAQYSRLKPEGFYIEIDDTVRSASESVKIGLIASELSHIVEDVTTPAWAILKDRILYRFSKRYRILDERNTDLTTVLRGFGRELYEVMRFAEEHGYPYYREDGLSLRELEILLMKSDS